MAKKTITTEEFLQWAAARWWDNATIDSKVQELEAQWVEILWWDQYKQSVQQITAVTPPSQWPAWREPYAVWLWAGLTAAAPFVWPKLIKSMIWPSQTEIWDYVWRIKRNLVWQGMSNKLQAWDDTTKDILKLMANLPDSKGKVDSRWLYNYIGDVKEQAYQNKMAAHTQAASEGRFITTDALKPLEEHIDELKSSWAPKSEIAKAEQYLDEMKWHFDADWTMDVSKAEKIKKTYANKAAAAYDSAEKVWASAVTPEVQVQSKIADWFREQVKAAVPEAEPWNRTYHAAKDIEWWIAKMANKASKESVSTPFRIASTKVAWAIKSTPWIATAGKALPELGKTTYEERKIPWLVKTAKKYLNKFMDWIDTEATKGKWLLNAWVEMAEKEAPAIIKAWVKAWVKSLPDAFWWLPLEGLWWDVDIGGWVKIPGKKIWKSPVETGLTETAKILKEKPTEKSQSKPTSATPWAGSVAWFPVKKKPVTPMSTPATWVKFWQSFGVF